MFDTRAIRALGVVRVLAELAGCEWKREGDWMVTRCPFHEDGTPSFKVGVARPDRGRCFSCGAKGDVIELAQRHLNLDTRATLEALGERFGIDERPDGARSAPAPKAAPREDEPVAPPTTTPELVRALDFAFGMAEPAKGNTNAERYLSDRGLLGGDLRNVRIVEEPRAWWELIQRKVSVVDLGLRGLYVFVGRRLPFLLFGATAGNGEVQNLHVRHIAPSPADDTPRWLFGGPTSPWPFVAVPPPGVEVVSPRHVVVCEGATDALAWSAAGHIACGVPGAYGLKPWMARLLAGPFQGAIVAADADDGGRRAAPLWAAELSRAGIEVVVADLALGLPGAKDAGDYARDGAFSSLRAISLAARIEALPEAAQNAVIGRIEAATREEAPGTPPPEVEPEFEPAPESGPTPEPSPKAAPREEEPELVVGGELTLADIRARMKTTTLEWTLVMVDQWWSQAHKGATDPKLLGRLAIEWFLARGATFVPDDTGEPHMYFEKRLHHCAEKSRAWIGFLYRMGGINRATKDGKVILEAFQAHTWSQENAPRLQPWAFYDRERNELAVHTHDDEDRIAVVDEKGLRVVPNGSGRVLLRTDRATRPINVTGAPSVKKAAELLRDHFVSNLATSDEDRALVTCWVLTCWLRQRLNTRAMLFAQGSAGSGKSQAAKGATVLVFGDERLIDPTPAALRTEGAMQPLVALDNKESRNMNPDLVQFLLLTASGGTKLKRLEGTTDGIHAESFNALIMLTAIEPAGIEELAQRTLTVRFKHEHQRPDYQPSKSLRALAKARSTILTGTWAIIGDMLSGRAKDQIRALRDLIPAKHAVERLGEHLALMAYFADALRAACPDIWGESRPNGADLLKDWLHTEAQIAHEKAMSTDPIYATMTSLMWSWNRVVLRHDDYIRPAVDEQLYRCRPLYLSTGGRLVPEPEEGTRFVRGSKREKVIGGFAGSYNDLHADLMRVSRESSGGNAYSDAIKNTGVLSARMAKNNALDKGGWHVQQLRATSEGRIYKFWLDADRIDAAGDELAIERAIEARAAGETGHATEQTLPF